MNVDFSKIKAFCFDVDGVFTDGGILCDLNGELYRTFDSKDGLAVRMATMKGYPVGVLTGGRSASITARFHSMGVNQDDVFLGSRIKTEDLEKFCEKYSLSPSDILYVGDDLPDIPVMQAVGLGCCPSDSAEEVLEIADFVSSKTGGHGCIREVIEKVLKSKNDWFLDNEMYKAKF